MSSVRVRASGLTDPGRVRANNQDHFHIDLEHSLFLVSDGMGGQQAGEIASQAVCQALPQALQATLKQLRDAPRRVVELTLREIVQRFSQQLRDETAHKAGLKGMGATLDLLWLRQDQAHLVHMGDSRIYLGRGGQLRQLSEDHSVVALLVKHGDITLEEAAEHPARGKLSRFIGMEGEVYPDVFTLPVLPGDRLLLCTDGLWGMVPDAKMADLLRAHSQPQAACQALVEAANAQGGVDNITVVIVECEW
ncbi:MAG: protein phosphatase 2C domain-containing protein [Anaerolineales bacterium]|jgi:protein phosphatase|nr:protein phosphatase 2C domain-containing protein [Anaerolineales bacterium]